VLQTIATWQGRGPRQATGLPLFCRWILSWTDGCFLVFLPLDPQLDMWARSGLLHGVLRGLWRISGCRTPRLSAPRPIYPSEASGRVCQVEPELDEDEKAMRARKAEAQKAKQEGNAAYSARRFDEAITHYNRALELDDSDISFLTNR
jgi:tetratricopeptide (TPR) repeat protein